MRKKPFFPGKTVNFILGAKVVSTIFKDKVVELATVNTDWNAAFATAFELEVETIAGKYLGIGIRDKLFSVTHTLTILIDNVKVKLVTVKKNLEIDFKGTSEFDIIINELGMNVKSISRVTQPQLVALLSKFQKNLTPQVIAKITAGGMPATLPQQIADSADEIINLNNEQEALKNSVKEVTGKMLDDLNDLYKKVIKICKLASDFYKGQPEKKSIFSFSRILKNLGDTRPVAKEKPVTPVA